MPEEKKPSTTWVSSDDGHEEKHESFAMVGFSRCTGSPGRLFGSALRDHQSYVMLRITRAKRVWEGGYDRYYGSHTGDLIEVELSSAQFADLLTTVNVGSGVPCTIRRLNGQKVPRPPEIEVEVARVREDFRRQMKSLSRKAAGFAEEIKEILEKKTLTREDRTAIMSRVNNVMTEVSSNTPYMLELFEEASERVASSAKSEIDAFATHAVFAAGLQSLAERAAARAPELPEAAEPEDEK